MPRFIATPPRDLPRRLPRLVVGLVLCGVALACIVRASLGLDPWNVLHQGVSHHTGISIGMVSVLVAFAVLLAWIPLRQRIGIGTIANALIIGVTTDAVLAVAPGATTLAVRWAYLLVGLALIGPGIGTYIGARLGPGPRDGIMTGLAERGSSIRLVRTLIEVTALVIGVLLGGTVGVGTVLFALTVGPNAQFWLERLDLGDPSGRARPTDCGVELGATTP